jgi:hypothetical protein
LTEGESVPPDILRQKLSNAAGVTLQASASDNPIICVDENYQPLSEACSPKDVVRIQPDDWPVYASQAWTTVELARRHPRLGAIVAAEDEEKVARRDDVILRIESANE